MIRTILAAAAATVTATSTVHAQDGDETRYRQLAECVAFYGVSSGMDGAREVDPRAAAAIRLLGTEYMFEASKLSKSDDEAHTNVVSKLQEQNLAVSEQGTDPLVASYGGMCAALVSTLKAAR